MTLPVCRYSAQGVRPFDDVYSEFDRPLKSVIEGSAQAGLVVHAERAKTCCVAEVVVGQRHRSHRLGEIGMALRRYRPQRAWRPHRSRCGPHSFPCRCGAAREVHTILWDKRATALSWSYTLVNPRRDGDRS